MCWVHDWLEGGEDAREALEASGVTVLENRAKRISARGNSNFWILGLDDQYGEACQLHGTGRRDDLEVALSQVKDDNAPRILLAHEPDIFPEAQKFVDLTVSGHTHGGQVRLPFIGALTIPSRLDRKFAKGAFEENGSTLIVGSGLGCSGFPIRFLCPPELLLIEIYVRSQGSDRIKGLIFLRLTCCHYLFGLERISRQKSLIFLRSAPINKASSAGVLVIVASAFSKFMRQQRAAGNK